MRVNTNNEGDENLKKKLNILVFKKTSIGFDFIHWLDLKNIQNFLRPSSSNIRELNFSTFSRIQLG